MIDKVAALIIKDRKLLLVRERGKKMFLLPGGRRKFGESDEACLRRELREELSVDVSRMDFFGMFNEAFGVVSIIAYLCKTDGDMKPSHEIEELLWVDSGTDVKMHPLTKDKIIAELIEEGIIK